MAIELGNYPTDLRFADDFDLNDTPKGAVIYNHTQDQLMVWTGSKWIPLLPLLPDDEEEVKETKQTNRFTDIVNEINDDEQMLLEAFLD